LQRWRCTADRLQYLQPWPALGTHKLSHQPAHMGTAGLQLTDKQREASYTNLQLYTAISSSCFKGFYARCVCPPPRAADLGPGARVVCVGGGGQAQAARLCLLHQQLAGCQLAAALPRPPRGAGQAASPLAFISDHGAQLPREHDCVHAACDWRLGVHARWSHPDPHTHVDGLDGSTTQSHAGGTTSRGH
jgi:hypothetical protein